MRTLGAHLIIALLAFLMIDVSAVKPTHALEGIPTASPSAPRHFFEFYPKGSSEPSVVGYLATGKKSPYINFPVYRKDSSAPSGFLDPGKILSITLGETISPRPAEIVLRGSTKPMNVYLREGFLVSDDGLSLPLWNMDEGTLKRKAAVK